MARLPATQKTGPQQQTKHQSQHQQYRGNKAPGTKMYGAPEGLYGPDNYRVQQDTGRPSVFHIWGRHRYQQTSTPCAATLPVTRLAPVPDAAGMTHGLPRPVRAYAAFATFVLRADVTAKGAGHCRRRAAPGL